MGWILSSSSDPVALAVVDGTGRHSAHGPHYSRRTPGSKTFTGVGKEVVLVTEDGNAVWACVLQRTPARRGSGASRGRIGVADPNVRWIWRNMLFRNLGAGLSSDLIRAATEATYRYWQERYGELPTIRLRTEIEPSRVRSTNPGYCYQQAGWERGEQRRGKLFYYAPSAAAEVAARGSVASPGLPLAQTGPVPAAVRSPRRDAAGSSHRPRAV